MLMFDRKRLETWGYEADGDLQEKNWSGINTHSPAISSDRIVHSPNPGAWQRSLVPHAGEYAEG